MIENHYANCPSSSRWKYREAVASFFSVNIAFVENLLEKSSTCYIRT